MTSICNAGLGPTRGRNRDSAIACVKTSVSQEDYLKLSGSFLKEGPATNQRATGRNWRSSPAVTAALKRMRRDDLVSVARRPYRPHAQGRAIAERMALRHQLAEMLLTDVIGLRWSAHDEQAPPTRHFSEVRALLLKRLPTKSCPHGVPLRGGFAQLPAKVPCFSPSQASERAEIVAFMKGRQFWISSRPAASSGHATLSRAANTTKLSLFALRPHPAPRQTATSASGSAAFPLDCRYRLPHLEHTYGQFRTYNPSMAGSQLASLVVNRSVAAESVPQHPAVRIYVRDVDRSLPSGPTRLPPRH